MTDVNGHCTDYRSDQTSDRSAKGIQLALAYTGGRHSVRADRCASCLWPLKSKTHTHTVDRSIQHRLIQCKPFQFQTQNCSEYSHNLPITSPKGIRITEKREYLLPPPQKPLIYHFNVACSAYWNTQNARQPVSLDAILIKSLFHKTGLAYCTNHDVYIHDTYISVVHRCILGT